MKNNNGKVQFLAVNLKNSIFAYIFPLILFTLLFPYMERFTVSPLFLLIVMLLAIPVVLIGMIAGVQTTILLQKLIGKKPERILEKLIALCMIVGLACYYQFVLVPAGIVPSVTSKEFWQMVKESFFRKNGR